MSQVLRRLFGRSRVSFLDSQLGTRHEAQDSVTAVDMRYVATSALEKILLNDRNPTRLAAARSELLARGIDPDLMILPSRDGAASMADGDPDVARMKQQLLRPQPQALSPERSVTRAGGRSSSDVPQRRGGAWSRRRELREN